MNHYIKKCKECQTVIGQCRCFAENKFVEWGVCEKCSQKIDRVQDARRDAALACADLQVADAYVPASSFYPALDALIAAVREERVEVTEAMVAVRGICTRIVDRLAPLRVIEEARDSVELAEYDRAIADAIAVVWDVQLESESPPTGGAR